MKKLFKYSQQIILATILVAVSTGIVFAGPSFDVTTLTFGFIRAGNSHPDPYNHGIKRFFYGYGWSGLNQEYGYGYGYSDKSGDEGIIVPWAEYGFEGEEGPVTIDKVAVTQTVGQITYSTNYLARLAWGVWLGYPNPTGENLVTFGGDTEEYFSGEQILNITGLSCDTQYYYQIMAKDAANNQWPLEDSFTTDSCSSGTQVVGGVSSNTEITQPSNPQGLRLPSIFLRLGSIGVDVQDLQKLLNHIGVFLDSHGVGSPGNETQYFGQKTFAAVKAFQQVFDLKKVDGIYGIETQTAMSKLLN